MVRKFSVSLVSVACILVVADLALACGGGRRGGGGGCGGGYGGGPSYYGPRSYNAGPYGSPYAMGDYWNSPSSSFYFAPDGGAQVRVLVPDPNATVMFNGQATQQMGNERLFFTPPLQAGPGNTYRVRATWRQGGKDVTQERTIDVNPGSTMTVDFTRPASEALPQAQNLQGKIIRTDTDHFVLRGSDNQEITVYTNPQTRFMMNNNTAAFSDIRVGNNVNLGYTMQGDRRIANSVTISK